MGALKVYNGTTSQWEYATGSGGGTVLAYKTVDKGMVNTATLASDDELFLTVPRAGTYVVDMLLIFTGPTNAQAAGAGIKIAMTLPSGATLRLHQFGPGVNTSTTYDPAVDKGLTGDISTRVMGSFGTGTDIFARYHGLLTVPVGGAGGVLRLTWAPAVVHATLSSYLRTGSFLRLDAGGSGSGSSSGSSSTPAAYAGRYLAGTQNIPAGTATTVLWDTQTAAAIGITYNATTGEFIVPTDGTYTIAATGAWPINTTGNARSTIIQVNGVTRAQTGLPPSALNTTGMGVEVVHTLSLAAGDRISVQVYQNSTANPLALYPSEAFTRVSIASTTGGGSAATPLAMGKYTNTGVQAIPTGNWTRITGLTTIWLDGGATRTTDYIVVPTTGRYAIAGYLGWASSPSGSAFRRIVGIGRNWTIATPSANIIGSTETPATSGQTTFPSCRYYEEHDLVAGDMICLLGYQNSGADLNTMTTTQDTMLSVRAVPMTTGGSGSGSGGSSLAGFATIGTDSATMAAGVETLRLAASFTGQTGQQYRIKAMCVPRIDTAGGYVNARLRWDTAATGVTGTVMEFGQTDFRLANRPEGVYVESPPFLYTGTNNTPLYAKLTLTFGSGIGYDNSLTIGPTWVEVEAVGSGGGSVVQSYVMLKGGSTNLTTQFADAGWRDVSVPNTLMSSGSGITAAGNVVTVAQAGLYIVSAGVLMGSGGTNRRIVAVESFVAETLGNGVPLVRSEMGGLAGMFPTFALSGDVYLAAGTKIRLIGYQNQGGGTALAQRDDMQSAYFNVRKVV